MAMRVAMVLASAPLADIVQINLSKNDFADQHIELFTARLQKLQSHKAEALQMLECAASGRDLNATAPGVHVLTF